MQQHINSLIYWVLSTQANCCIGAFVLLERKVAFRLTQLAHSFAMAFWVNLFLSWISNSPPKKLRSRPALGM
jgi:hypothetical protein